MRPPVLAAVMASCSTAGAPVASMTMARCYFADNDLIAAGAIKAFREAGKRIPEDIAVVGFDNIPISQILDLTTINVPKEYMGALAAGRLFERIRSPRLPAVKLAVETALIDRFSC